MMMTISIIMGIKGWAKCILDTLSKLPNILFPNQIQNCLLVSRENWRCWRDGAAFERSIHTHNITIFPPQQHITASSHKCYKFRWILVFLIVT